MTLFEPDETGPERPRFTPDAPYDWESNGDFLAEDCQIDDLDRDLFFIELRDHMRAADRRKEDRP